MSLLHHLIPQNRIGGQSGATATAKLNSREEAATLYKFAKYKLLDVNNWYAICDKKGSEFFLADAHGKPVPKPSPEVGDLIKIKLPAPRNKDGDGYDWVKVERIIHEKDPLADEEACGFTVRPTPSPFHPGAGTAHFYKSSATSTFLVYRKGREVAALERGRNEVPNSGGAFIHNLRNLVVAVGAMLGLSKPQWQLLVNSVLGEGKAGKPGAPA